MIIVKTSWTFVSSSTPYSRCHCSKHCIQHCCWLLTVGVGRWSHWLLLCLCQRVTIRRTAVGAVAATTVKTLPGVAAAVGLADIEKWHWNLCAMNQFHHQNNYLTMPHPNSSIKYNQLYCSSDKYIHPSFSEDVFMPACCSCQRKGGSPLLSDNAVRAADCCSHNSSPLLCPPQHGFISPHLKWELSLVIITLFCIPRQDSAQFVWSWSQLRCQQDFTESHSARLIKQISGLVSKDPPIGYVPISYLTTVFNPHLVQLSTFNKKKAQLGKPSIKKTIFLLTFVNKAGGGSGASFVNKKNHS